MLTHMQLRELVWDYIARWELINKPSPEDMKAEGSCVSSVGALKSMQYNMNVELAAEFVSTIVEHANRGTPVERPKPFNPNGGKH